MKLHPIKLSTEATLDAFSFSVQKISLFSYIISVYLTCIVVISIFDQCISYNSLIFHLTETWFESHTYMCIWPIFRMLCLISCIPWCCADCNVSIMFLELREPRHVTACRLKVSIKWNICKFCLPVIRIKTPCCIFNSVYQSFLFSSNSSSPGQNNFSTASPSSQIGIHSKKMSSVHSSIHA